MIDYGAVSTAGEDWLRKYKKVDTVRDEKILFTKWIGNIPHNAYHE